MAVSLQKVLARDGVELVADRLIAVVDGARKVIGEVADEAALLNEHGEAFMEATAPVKGGNKKVANAKQDQGQEGELGDE